MSTVSQTAPVSSAALWTGRILSTLIVLMLLMSGAMKLKMKHDFDNLPPASSVQSDAKDAPHNPQVDLDPIGWKVEIMGVVGFVEICCALLYAIPRTAVLGAILITGYLGGACATHLRVGESGLCFAPVAMGVVAWIALYLRDRRIRELAPFRSL
jgi:hypothetical protein